VLHLDKNIGTSKRITGQKETIFLVVYMLLRVFENRVLRRIFGPEREEVAGGWRRLHNEELHNFCYNKYYQGDQIRDEIGQGM
jgi:hypothetical protein